MPKSLNDILKGVKKSSTETLTTGKNPGVDYADKMKDGRDFVAQHSVEKHADRVGNENPASKIKQTELKRHGNVPSPKDINVYKKNQQVGQPENVKEAKLCETCGKSPCECGADQPMYGKKDKAGKKKLLTDKKIQEMATSQNQAIAARIALKHKKEGTMPPKGTASHSMMGMSTKQLHDYTHAEKGAPKKVDEAVHDHSPKKTASEEARKEIHKAIVRKKEKEEKMKEEAAAAETPITFPVTNSREGFRV